MRFVPITWAAILCALNLASASALARTDTVDERHVADLRDLNRLDQRHPEAGARFDAAEAALARGDVAAAAQGFREVVRLAPESALALRRLCQVELEQGLRLTAIDTCTAAVRTGGSPMDLRALAQAIAAGPATAEQMSLALQAVRTAKHAMPDQPWGYAAECDIAIRIGDETMFNTCKADLERIAPGHYETRRIQNLKAPTPLGSLLAWFMLAAGAFATLLHAAKNAWARRSHVISRKSASAVAVLPLLLFVALPVNAAPEADDAPPQNEGRGLSKWPIDPNNPVGSVPSPKDRDDNPLQYGYFLMDLGVEAEDAVKAKDYPRAARYFEAMAKAVPDEALGFRKACEYYELSGDRERALPLCAGALTVHNVVVGDYLEFAKLQMASPTPLTSEQIEGLNQIVDHLKTQPGGEVASAQIECELGTRLEDAVRLRRCAQELAQKAPKEPTTLTYRWALALADSDFDGARRLIDEAKAASLDPQAVQSMREATARRANLWTRLSKHWRAGAVALLLIAAATLARNAWRRREKLAPSAAA